MPLRTRRWDDPPDAGDGTRILVCRYRPRGLPKSDETWDLWLPDLAPSKDLHAAAYGKAGRVPVPWAVYQSRYLAEMRSPEARSTIADLARRHAAGETLTLLCSSSCTREDRCHRSLLKSLIEKAAGLRIDSSDH